MVLKNHKNVLMVFQKIASRLFLYFHQVWDTLFDLSIYKYILVISLIMIITEFFVFVINILFDIDSDIHRRSLPAGYDLSNY